MNKRGFQVQWQNKHWMLKPTAYQRGQTDPNIPSGGTGIQPNYLSVASRGYGEVLHDEDYYTTEKLYLSAPYISDIGNYRIGVLFKRASYNATAATAYTFIAECGSDGRLLSYNSSSRTSFDNAICTGSHSKAWLLNKKDGYTWTDILSNTPLITVVGVDLTNGTQTTELFRKVKDTWTADIETIMFTFCDKTGDTSTAVSDSALTPTTTTPDPNDICSRMSMFSDESKWAYWYGGNGQVANLADLNRLAAAYPKIYDAAHIEHCKQDIAAGKRVADCSYAVSYAYNIARTTAGVFAQMYVTWTGTPKNGMILVRASNGTHVAIYKDGHTMEMNSTYEDYLETEYIPSKWWRVAYDPNRAY
jgi:hypothetical protein